MNNYNNGSSIGGYSNAISSAFAPRQSGNQNQNRQVATRQSAPVAQKPKFSVAIQTDGYKNLINSTLGDPKRAQNFIASISSAVSANPALQDCDAGSILAGGLLGESLQLTPSPQLGYFYLVPFNDRKNNRMVATFILGFRGYLQLAQRSGQYRKINVLEIKQGELVKWDRETEEIKLNLIDDELTREALPTIGYYAFFEYVNGFRKALYWSKNKMESHAQRYSKGYAAKKGYTFWESNFDAMAIKTMLRQLIGRWGIMSIEMQTALINDGNAFDRFGGEPIVTSNDDLYDMRDAFKAAAQEAEPAATDDGNMAEGEIPMPQHDEQPQQTQPKQQQSQHINQTSQPTSQQPNQTYQQQHQQQQTLPQQHTQAIHMAARPAAISFDQL